MDTEVLELLRKGVITPAQGSKNHFSEAEKKKSHFHPITNLKKLNPFIRYSHFKMESLKELKYLLSQNDIMLKIDL